jgi:RNA polymerase sigma factor (sigma-70 family)
VSDESTAVLQLQLERALAGDAEARQRLLELTRNRLMHHARRFLHSRYARLEPFQQTDDVVQELYLKILENQDRFWVNADGTPVRTLAEFFGHTSAWVRDVLCDLLRKAYGRADNRPAMLPLDSDTSGAGARHEPGSSTLNGEKIQRWTEFHEAAARLPDDLRAVFDLLWYQEMSQADAAALLGIAVPTVKLRWMKARLQVQQALGGSPFDDTGSPDRPVQHPGCSRQPGCLE